MVKGRLGACVGWDLCVVFGGEFVVVGFTHGELEGSRWGLGGETVWRRVQISGQSVASNLAIRCKLRQGDGEW